MLVLGAMTLYPIGYVLWMSVNDWTWGGDAVFSGWQNYKLLWLKGSFLIALTNTVTFAVSAVAVELVLGMILALAANRVTRGAGIFRVLLILPLMVSGIAVSLVWKVLLDPTFGIINMVLGEMGLPQPNWLGSPDMAMPSLVMVETWWQTGFVFIILAAALKSLPEEPFEAARLEGANGWQTFRYLTLPMLKPVIVTVVVFIFIGSPRSVFIPVVSEMVSTPMASALVEMSAIAASPLILLDSLSRSSRNAASTTTGMETASGASPIAIATASEPKPTCDSPSPIME